MPVAAVPVVAAGIVALVFGWALWQLFGGLLRAAFGQVPYVGGFIVQQTDNLLWSLWRSVAPWANQALYAVHDLVLIPIINLGDVLNQLGTNIAKLQGQHSTTVHVRIPNAVYQAEVYANQQAAAAIDFARRSTQQAIQYTQLIEGQIITYVQGVEREVIGFTDQVQRIVIAYASAIGRQAIDYADQVGQRAIGFAQQVGADQASFSEGLYQQSTAYARALQQEAIDYDGALHRQALDHADQVGTQAEGYARALQQQVIDTVGVSVGVVAAQVQDLERSPCIQHCGPLGDLGGLLQDLEDAGALALLVAIAAAAIKDPQGVLDETRAVALPAIQTAGQGVQDLVGLAVGG